ncbi:MAG: RND family transporter [Nevskiaceae bacterium]|nr:MAG: RND family transporter [Nevskiaceae bacterium]TBR71409.1 MAG: RND family transporter [Nevskiaceae bacterium]
MAHAHDPHDANIETLEQFDRRSGSWLERQVFTHRLLIVAACVVITVVLGVFASHLRVTASYQEVMPQSQAFIKNYQHYAGQLNGLGNAIRVVVENTHGDIYESDYLRTLQKINDKIYLMPSVDRAYMRSLWLPALRWTEITPEGYKGGPVMPPDIGSSGPIPESSIAQLRRNVDRAGIVGSVVANDRRSTLLYIPLIDRDPKTGAPLDYAKFHSEMEALHAFDADGVKVHIIGFAQLMGDLIDAVKQVLGYFLIAALIITIILRMYTRCWRSTAVVIGCTLVAVVWELGLMDLLGFTLGPYSILVPFLIFAIGVSHGSQKMNGIQQDTGRGAHKYVAARYTFRRLFLCGCTALLADAVGFIVLSVIDIPAIRELAAAAAIGVAVLIFTNLILIPIFLSYTGVSKRAAAMSLARMKGYHPVVEWLTRLTIKRRAVWVIAGAVVLAAGGGVIASHQQIGDLDPGAPELWPNSRYNQDNRYITKHYALSSDQLAVIVATPDQGIVNFKTLIEMDRLEEQLRDLPGVQTTVSAASLGRELTPANFEGSLKWETINRSPFVVQDAINYVYQADAALLNDARSVTPIIVYLTDHKAATLTSVVDVVEKFAAEHDEPDRKFLLAAGNAGISAATNIAVANANRTMLLYVYLAVIALCFITFRSWRAVLLAVIPLGLTSILCEALMVLLGIGVTVATLPVTALGVGIGVDYALYLLTEHLVAHRRGESVQDSYRQGLIWTGKIVALIGVTLAVAVGTWAFSPIKFQASMGILLAFMFLWNMVGALVLIPALAAFIMPAHRRDAAATAQG